ncbi:type IX secretion system membrane protein PorP/SprF [Puteibacter caeruleilacunae]|nr:type IX secretion system membrane protein PorP/SprF [Puteibacter caeruleilacunae]
MHKILRNGKAKVMRLRFDVLVVLLVLIGGMSIKSYAQQDPMYTQYMFNTQAINPGYVGSWNTLGFMFLTRQQWVGFEGHPQTNTFSVQSYVPNHDNVGVGLSVMHDKTGLEKRFAFFADYSYRLKLNEETSLRLGLKGGFMQYQNNLNEYTLEKDGRSDPMFQGVVSKMMPNFGIGAYLHSERYYVGLSVPKLLENGFNNSQISDKVKAENRHIYIMGGAVFNVNEDIKFKPSTLVKVVGNSPVQVDINANFLLKDKLWLGGMYRTGDSFGVIGQWMFDKSLRIGYAMDFTTSELKNNHSGVHEIMITYEFKWERNTVRSPRYF